MPRQWAVYEQNTTTLATAAFSAPGSDAARAAVRRDQSGARSRFRPNSADDHRPVPDAGALRYRALRRAEPRGDGRWKLAHDRAARRGRAARREQVNTFIERAGTFVGLIEVLMPDDAGARCRRCKASSTPSRIHQDAALRADRPDHAGVCQRQQPRRAARRDLEHADGRLLRDGRSRQLRADDGQRRAGAGRSAHAPTA